MKINPPKRALQFLRWFCREDYLEEIEGDLTEVFRKQVESAPHNAKWRFAWSVVRYFRPEFMKSFRNSYQPDSYGMYKSYFKIGWRTLARNKGYSIINIAGLALSMTCGIFIFSLVKHHLSFDNFHENSDRIYRMVTDTNRDVT
ncbi:MAG: ABC transporter permease, partial [Marivirga sp.]|nr:ABC transporter permease [Marivirga sp.]